VIITRAEEMGHILTSFFGIPALVFLTGGLLVGLGLLIIGLHQTWHGLSAILISLFGWFLLLRGLALLVMPDVFFAAAQSMAPQPIFIRALFAVIFLIGLWLSYDGWHVRSADSVPNA
jgi:hypothetical protein